MVLSVVCEGPPLEAQIPDPEPASTPLFEEQGLSNEASPVEVVPVLGPSPSLEDRSFVEEHFTDEDLFGIPPESVVSAVAFYRNRYKDWENFSDDDLVAAINQDIASDQIYKYTSTVEAVRQDYGEEGASAFEHTLLELSSDTILRAMSGQEEAVVLVYTKFRDNDQYTRFSSVLRKFTASGDFLKYYKNNELRGFWEVQSENSAEKEAVLARLQMILVFLQSYEGGDRHFLVLSRLKGLISKIEVGQSLDSGDREFVENLIFLYGGMVN